MGSINIAFDNADIGLGHYFEASKLDLISIVNSLSTNSKIKEIDSRICNQPFIDMYIPQININNFLFFAYSHGFDDCLTVNGAYYIHSKVNSHLFINSLFYSMSCSTANDLGKELCDKGCLAFIGYDDIAYALPGRFQQISIDCDNYAIRKFLENSTIKESFDMMKEYFTIKIDEIENQGEILIAADLRSNRDALQFMGNENLKKGDFNII